MEKKRTICFVYSVPISEMRADFMCTIPLRMRHLIGQSVDVSVLYSGVINEEKLCDSGINVYKMGLPRLAMKCKAIRVLGVMLRTNRVAAKESIDLFINANNHYYLFAVAVGAKLAGKAVLGRVTGILPQGANSSGLKRLRKALGRIMARASLELADKGICLSAHLKKKLMDSGVTSDKLIVLSQGIDLTRFKMRKRNGSERAKTILYVGRLEAMKGLEDALRAFMLVKQEYMELTFIICGDGSLKQQLVSIYGRADGITFLGHVPHDELPAIYRSADILVLPSYSEGLPNVVLEAMASGVAVIASNVGDNNILLDYGRRGILVEPGDIGQICSAILQYIDNPSFFYTCVRDARRYVEREHSFDVLRGRYLRLFASVVKE